MIRLGLVGSNFGCNVLLPAFRRDPRCEIAVLCGSNPERTAERAQQHAIPRAVAHWREIVSDPTIDAVLIATPPKLQSEIAAAALNARKAVFVEKPLAADLAAARAIRDAAQASGRPAMIDLEFPELPVWQRARAMLRDPGIGTLRHIVVNWQVENYATRMRLKSWKTDAREGGGVLGNFVSHCFHYLEDFGGPIAGLSARLQSLPGAAESQQSSVTLAGTFASGASFSLSMSCASYLGSGHRIEIYGEDGTLMLINESADYMRGFNLFHARRPATERAHIEAVDPDDNPAEDGRIAPVARMARRFLEAIETGGTVEPGVEAGYRVQMLIEAANRSHANGCLIDISKEKGLA